MFQAIALARQAHAAMDLDASTFHIFMSSSASSTSGRKLHKRYTPFVFAFYMAGIMAFLMCCTIVASNSGFGAGYLQRVLSAYALAMPVAFCCVVMVRPLVLRLVALTVHPH